MRTIDEIVADIRNRNDGGAPLDEESSHPLAEDMFLIAKEIEESYSYEKKAYVYESDKVNNLLKDLFACCRNMQNKLHSINAQVSTYKYFKESKPANVEKCIKNIEDSTRYIYDGDKHGFFPDVAQTLEATRAFLDSKNAFGKFNDYTGFGNKKEEEV